MVHIHHSQPLKIKFGKNHFLGSATLGPKQYRKGVKAIFKLLKSLFRTLEIGLWGEHIFSESDFLKYHVQRQELKVKDYKADDFDYDDQRFFDTMTQGRS